MPFSSDTRSKILNRMTKIYRAVSAWLLVRPSQFVSLLKDKSLYKHATYYPEHSEKVKSPKRIFMEQVGQILRFGKVNKFYFLYGFDVKTKEEQEKYVHAWPFQLRRGDLNLSLYHDYSCILRDKLVFSLFAEGIGVKTVKILFYTTEGKLFDYATKEECHVDKLLLLGDTKMFCKPLDGEEGKGAFVLQVKNGVFYQNGTPEGIDQIRSILTQQRYLVQEFLTQHEEMSRLHSQSINTIRLVTVRGIKDGAIHILPSILRIGTGDSVMDNTSRGGVAVGVNIETGYLKQYGFFKPQYGTKTDVHPDSKIKFEDFQIPYFEEVKRQAVYFHSMLPQIHSVGWDIAVGPNGPIFVEGNDNWEINGPQSCNGGMKKEFDAYFY